MKLQIFIILIMLSYSNMKMANFTKPKSEMATEKLAKREEEEFNTGPLSNLNQSVLNDTQQLIMASLATKSEMTTEEMENPEEGEEFNTGPLSCSTKSVRNETQMKMASLEIPKSEMNTVKLAKREEEFNAGPSSVPTKPLEHDIQVRKMKPQKGIIFDVIQRRTHLGKIAIGVYLDAYPKSAGMFYVLATDGINGKSFDNCRFYLVDPDYVETGQFLCDNGQKSLGVVWNYDNGEKAMLAADVGDPGAMLVTRMSTGWGKNANRCCHFRIYEAGKIHDSVMLGKVMRGKETVRRIQNVPLTPGKVPVVPVLIKNVKKWDPNTGEIVGHGGEASSSQTANLLLLFIIIIFSMSNVSL